MGAIDKLHTLRRLEVEAVDADCSEVHRATGHRGRFRLAARDAVQYQREDDREEVEHGDHK